MYKSVLFLLISGVLVAPAQETQPPKEDKGVVIVYEDGTKTIDKLPAIAGKVQLLGKPLLIQGMSLELAFIVEGEMTSYRLEGLPEGVIFDLEKVAVAGGTAYIFSQLLFFPPGEHQIRVICYNGRGSFSSQVTVKVIERIPIGLPGGEDKLEKNK